MGGRLRSVKGKVLARAVGVRTLSRRVALTVILISLLLVALEWALNGGIGYIRSYPAWFLSGAGLLVGSALLCRHIPSTRRGVLLVSVCLSLFLVEWGFLTWPTAAALVYLAIAEDPRRAPWPGVAAGAAGVLISNYFLDGNGDGIFAVLVGGISALFIRALDRSAELSKETVALRLQAAATVEQVQWLQQRSALARELHDVVGHHVTAIVVTAEAAQVSQERVTALRSIADRGRLALTELDILVQQLRDPGKPVDVTAPPRLGDIDELLAEPLRGSGVAVDVKLAGDLGSVAEVSTLTAYRIVQEALTNVARHAQASTVWIEIYIYGSLLRLRVSDDGVGMPEAPSRGSGLLGMTERVAALNGILAITSRPGGGTVVDAFLPHTLQAPRGDLA